MTDYSEMSYDELIAANQKLMEKRAEVLAEIKDQQLALHKVLDLRSMQRQLTNNMTDNERAVLAEALTATQAAENDLEVSEGSE